VGITRRDLSGAALLKVMPEARNVLVFLQHCALLACLLPWPLGLVAFAGVIAGSSGKRLSLSFIFWSGANDWV